MKTLTSWPLAQSAREMLLPRSVGCKNQYTAWDHFDKLPHPNPLSQAKCRHYGALIKYSSGTTVMRTHLDRSMLGVWQVYQMFK